MVAPCMLIISSPLFVQLMHANYVKLLKTFKTTTVAATWFGLHKPPSGS
jgi:hypothetical protein